MRRLILLFLALCLGKLAFSSSKYEDDYEDDYEDAYDYEGDYDDVDYEYNEIEDDGDEGERTEDEYGTYYDYDNEERSNTVKWRGEGLRNKHLIIEGETWDPFLMYDYDEYGGAIAGTYRGVMWDLLLFMQKARNFTFTMVSEAEWEWGECYAINNCTGMIGMVNRKEVDLAIGKE